MRMRSELGQVRGLGAAKEGLWHWWKQRLTALFLVPLCSWLVIVVVGLKDVDHETVRAFFGTPGNTALMIVTIGTVFYHAQLGLQVVIEDYVHLEIARLTGLILVKSVTILLAIFAVVAVLKIAHGG